MTTRARDIYSQLGAPARAGHAKPGARTAALRRELARAMPQRRFTVTFFDGGELGATESGGPVFTVRSPAAIAHLLRAPGQLGLVRAYIAGALEVDDLDAVMQIMDGFQAPSLDAPRMARLGAAAISACGLMAPPPVPASEMRARGRLHSIGRDSRSVRHHYDVSNDFFKLFLDETMTYSCAIFSRGAATLAEAQEAKLQLVCEKLALKEGERLLDVGCGWGGFLLHAAQRYKVSATGITISANQAALARQRVAEAGLSERVEIRLADYRDLAGERYDAIASIGMVEHVGERQIDRYAAQLASLLAPGGRLLNHGIARLRDRLGKIGSFTQRYVFPDGDTLPVSRVQLALERAGFEIEHVEGFAADYSRTLGEWIARLEASLQEAARLAGPERLRVWRLYLRGAKQRFDGEHISVYQVRCRKL